MTTDNDKPKRERGRPFKDANIERKPFSCRLHPNTLIWINGEKGRTGKSAGEIVDWLVEDIQTRPDEQLTPKSEP